MCHHTSLICKTLLCKGYQVVQLIAISHNQSGLSVPWRSVMHYDYFVINWADWCHGDQGQSDDLKTFCNLNALHKLVVLPHSSVFSLSKVLTAYSFYCSNGLILRGTLGYRKVRKSLLLLRPLCHLIHTWRVVRLKDTILMAAAITPMNRLVRASDLITSRWLWITWPMFHRQ